MGVHVSSDPCHWPMRALVTSACSPIGPHYQTKPHNVLSGCNDERVQASTDAQSPSVTQCAQFFRRAHFCKKTGAI